MRHDDVVHLSSEALRPGMVLGDDLASAGGMLLAVAGTALTRRHLRQMRLWRISSAAIISPARTDAAFLPDQPLHSPLGQWLAQGERDPFMQELARLARERFAQRRQGAARAPEEVAP